MKMLDKIYTKKRSTALLGIAASAVFNGLVLYYWMAGWIAALVRRPEAQVLKLGLFLVIVVTVTRAVLIWRGKDSPLTWIQASKQNTVHPRDRVRKVRRK